MSQKAKIVGFNNDKLMVDKKQHMLGIPEEQYIELATIAREIGKTPEEIVTELIGYFVKTRNPHTFTIDYPYSDFGE
ncbi:MAG: hypothetical protein ABWK01_03505 [Infirmifilum sp.]